MSVTITGFKTITKKDGTSFLALEITSGAQLLQSSKTGKYYASVQKCMIPATFNEEVAKSMLGQRIEGQIIRVDSEPYQYVDRRSGEVLTLQHSWAYCPPGSVELIGHTKIGELQTN